MFPWGPAAPLMPWALPSCGDLALSSRSAVGVLLPFQEFWHWALFHGNREKRPRAHCLPGSTSHHRARYCSQEVTATSRTARHVTTEPRWSLNRVTTAAQRLQDSSVQLCGKPLLDSPSKLFSPWEASTFTNGQDQQAHSSLGAAGKPPASQSAPFATLCLLYRRFSRTGTENGRDQHW